MYLHEKEIQYRNCKPMLNCVRVDGLVYASKALLTNISASCKLASSYTSPIVSIILSIPIYWNQPQFRVWIESESKNRTLIWIELKYAWTVCKICCEQPIGDKGQCIVQGMTLLIADGTPLSVWAMCDIKLYFTSCSILYIANVTSRVAQILHTQIIDW